MDRPDETSGSSAAPPGAALQAAAPAEAAPRRAFDRQPPRPLPPRAFGSQTAAARQQPVRDALSADAVFSAIDADVSSRSAAAVEAMAAEAVREIKQPRPTLDVSELALPSPSLAAGSDLGHTIPRRMFEPRFESAPQPAFGGLQMDPSLRPSAAPTETLPPPTRDYRAIVRRTIKLLAWLVIGWLAVVLALIVAYRFVNPPASTLMLQYWLTGQGVSQQWVAMDDISPNVVRAVLVSEDGRFCQHAGIDFDAIEEAIENTDGRARGGSTISMQVVKNLFLWPSKSYIRKAIELPLTYLMELIWPKRRIMEVYLNIAQWGPAVFGVGSAAKYHFGKSARALSARDAARLAVSLPNPLVRNAGKPGPGLQRLANAIQVRMRLAPSSQLSCVLPKRLY
jgi:monofunctional glycosyltransferase